MTDVVKRYNHCDDNFTIDVTNRSGKAIDIELDDEYILSVDHIFTGVDCEDNFHKPDTYRLVANDEALFLYTSGRRLTVKSLKGLKLQKFDNSFSSKGFEYHDSDSYWYAKFNFKKVSTNEDDSSFD